MQKLLLSDSAQFNDLKYNIITSDNMEFTFEYEHEPIKYPCIAVYHYYEDVLYGACYSMVFVYDFEMLPH
jgi:hypothetical protein